jgi:hypothetical protein
VGAIAGLAAAGALRAAQVLLGPLNVLFMGTQVVAVPEAVALSRQSHHRLRGFSLGLSTALAGAALAWGVIVVVLPDRLGEAILGVSWPDAQSVAPFAALAMAGTGATAGAFVGLRALAAARRSLRVRATVSPAILAGATLGAAAGGARGAAAGLAVATWFGVTLWWREFRAELRSRAANDAALAGDPLGRRPAVVPDR